MSLTTDGTESKWTHLQARGGDESVMGGPEIKSTKREREGQPGVTWRPPVVLCIYLEERPISGGQEAVVGWATESGHEWPMQSRREWESRQRARWCRNWHNGG